MLHNSCLCYSCSPLLAERVSFAAVVGFVYTAIAVLVRGSQVGLRVPAGVCTLQVPTTAGLPLSIVVGADHVTPLLLRSWASLQALMGCARQP